MFKALFSVTLVVTSAINLVFLFAAKDKPPDLLSASRAPAVGPPAQPAAERSPGPLGVGTDAAPQSPSPRRLSIRSNEAADNDTAGGQYLAGSRGRLRRAGAPPPTESSAWQTRDNQPNVVGVVVVAGEQKAANHEDDADNETSRSGTSEATRRAQLQTANRLSGRATTRRPPPPGPQPGGPIDESAKSMRRQKTSDNATDAPDAIANSIELGGAGAPEARARGKLGALKIRVKSSKNHVLVSVDGVLIYESGSASVAGAGGAVVSTAGATAVAHLRPLATPAPPTTSRSAGNPPPSNQERGLHVIVLNQFNGQLMAKRVFDTYSAGQDDELCLFLSQVRDGRLLVFAVRDEASFGMGRQSAARRLLGQLGSRRIQQLGWRNMWAFVGFKRPLAETNARLGGPDAVAAPAAEAATGDARELLSAANNFSTWAAPVQLEAQLPLAEPDAEAATGCARWQGPRAELERRRAFCDRVEGYGRVCECCARPSPISFAPRQPEAAHNWRLAGVPILVMASDRPYYLYRMLRSLLQADGVRRDLVTVFIDGFYEEPLAVCRLFNLRVVQHRPRGRSSARISHHYRTCLATAFDELFPEAQFAIIFEEDLDVARDALVYFNQTRALLERDPSLYCASAWNDQGYEHSAGADPGLVYRVETMPGLGWMLSRRLFKEELEARWPSSEQPHDWDMWIRTEAVRRQRECLIPDVSRTFHFGSLGTNINSYFQRQYFQKHAFWLAPPAPPLVVATGAGDDYQDAPPKRAGFTQFRLDELEGGAYERLLAGLIASARPLRPPASNQTGAQLELACSLAGRASAIDGDTGRGPIVIFIKMIDRADFANWLKLAQCWRIWDLDARGQHRAAWRLFLGGAAAFVVGAPASPYSRLKPADLVPFDFA